MRWVTRTADIMPSLEAARDLFQAEGVLALADLLRDLLAERGGVLPPKSDFAPERIKHFLPNVILLDFAGAEDAVFRLAGENVVARFGGNPKGRRYKDFVEPRRRDSVAQSFRLCLDTPCAMHIEMIQTFKSGKSMLCEVLGFPFAASPGSETRTMIFVDCVVETPVRYALNREQMTYTTALRRTFIDLGFGAPEGFQEPTQQNP